MKICQNHEFIVIYNVPPADLKGDLTICPVCTLQEDYEHLTEKMFVVEKRVEDLETESQTDAAIFAQRMRNRNKRLNELSGAEADDI
jgi:hypothetical protein